MIALQQQRETYDPNESTGLRYAYSSRESRPGARGAHARAAAGTEADTNLMATIVAHVMSTDYIDVSHVHISVSRSQVTLSGTVQTEANRREIEQLVAGCDGVHLIHNQLRVEFRAAVER
jgi:osmotically-inducible protein OsmY